MTSFAALVRVLHEEVSRLLWAGHGGEAQREGLRRARAGLGPYEAGLPAARALAERIDGLATGRGGAEGLLGLSALLFQVRGALLGPSQVDGPLRPLPPQEAVASRAHPGLVTHLLAGLRGEGNWRQADAVALALSRGVVRDLRLLSAWAWAAGEPWFSEEQARAVFSQLGRPGLDRLLRAFDPQGGEDAARRLALLLALCPSEEANALGARALREGSGEVRALALARWGERDPAAASAGALALAQDPSTPAPVRAAAASLLAYAPRPDSFDWLVRALTEEVPQVQRAAAYALRAYGGLGAGPHLLDLLQRKPPEVLVDVCLRALCPPLDEERSAWLVARWWSLYRLGPHRRAAEEAIARAATVTALRSFVGKLPRGADLSRLRPLWEARASTEPAIAAFVEELDAPAAV